MRVDNLNAPIKNLINELRQEFDIINEGRISILKKLLSYISSCKKDGRPANLVFICTHNSRRSHIAQIWAQAAAYAFGLDNVFCFSGGTEATAFNPRAVKAIVEAGFNVTIEKEGTNPEYSVKFSEEAPPIRVFSKVYGSPFNPKKNFAAVMTCSHADENCPFIPGADVRIPLTYDDPKDFDGTSLEEEKYRERVREIGREILWVFSNL
ncbi:MAG TPA: protein-tyrosine-phosphatase [Cyclobacteriaceae bacterium]|nr:protein-tyrosine-phosphatase [Cyclobacteriaceae bacterium]